MLTGALGLDPSKVGSQKAAPLVSVLKTQGQHIDVFNALGKVVRRHFCTLRQGSDGDLVA